MMKSKLILVGGILIFFLFVLWLYSSNRKNGGPEYRTEELKRGTITATVTAAGTLAAVTTVKVGSQVSGIISQLYADFNSEVRKGQLLAELDPAPFQAVVDQRRADLERAKVEVRNARITFERAQKLHQANLLSDSEYDVAQANVQSAEAQLKQIEAALRQAETNLKNTRIVSPIDGVVVNREYDIGQTVAASFQAPTLFTIAQDLKKMQVSTNIDEADIGKIRIGQKAIFTVDAFPERTFEGVVSQIRLSSQVVQNVVTYPVLIDVANEDLALKPGMTANVTIPFAVRENVLRIPNSALRFKPETEEGKRGPKRSQTVYVLEGKGVLKPVEVTTSITDGVYSALETGNLREGSRVVTGLATSRAIEATGGIGSRRRRGF